MQQNNPAKRILLIDDDEFIVDLLSLLLSEKGYRVFTASNGQEAIDLISEQAVDLIIVDLMMPKMDGLQFIHWLRKEFNASLPVLVLSGMTNKECERLVAEAGGDALLYKPVRIPELMAKIQEFTQTHAL